MNTEYDRLKTCKVRLIEEDFHRLMFDTDGMP